MGAMQWGLGLRLGLGLGIEPVLELELELWLGLEPNQWRHSSGGHCTGCNAVGG